VRVSSAVARVLTAPQYQMQAQRHAQRLQSQNPVNIACEAIETLLNVA